MNQMYGLKMSFNRIEMLNKLTENREIHKKIVTEAKKNYIVALQKELALKLKDLEAGKKINPNSKLPIPSDNSSEYDTAISMLKMSKDDTVELTQDQFHCYVLDKWHWKENFLVSNSTYSKLAEDTLVGATADF